MGGARASNKLFVEGPDDCFVIINLVQQLRADLQGDAKRWCGGFEIDTSNDDQALARFGDSLKSRHGNYGLVLDADSQPAKDLQARWRAVEGILRQAGVNCPSKPPPGGWLGSVPPSDARVVLGPRIGVWIMPDNLRNGALEAFLEPLIPEGDSSWQFAVTVAQQAKASHGAPYPDPQTSKARLHTWLAWRSEPGRPYGRAIATGDLKPAQCQNAARFVEWFTTLFELHLPNAGPPPLTPDTVGLQVSLPQPPRTDCGNPTPPAESGNPTPPAESPPGDGAI